MSEPNWDYIARKMNQMRADAGHMSIVEQIKMMQRSSISRREEIATLRAELERVRGERDAARAAAARYKRRAYLLYRTWCGYWGAPVDWGFLRTALHDPEVRDE